MTSPLVKKLVVATLCRAAVVAGAVAHGQVAHYLDLNCYAGIVAVEVNGFPIHEAAYADSGASSTFISPFLKNGANALRASFHASPEAEVSWLEIDLVSAGVEVIRDAGGEQETEHFSRRFDPAGKSMLGAKAKGQAEALLGSISPESGELAFVNTATRRWGWGGKIVEDGIPVQGLPVKLEVESLGASLAQVELHLIDSKEARQVVFKNLKLPQGSETLELNPAQVAKGARWLGKGGFDTIWIFGFSAEGVEKVEAGGLAVHWLEPEVEISEEIALEIPHRWAWQEGAEVVPALADPAKRQELVDFLKSLHATLDKGPVGEWGPFFERKLQDLATATAAGPERMRTGQTALFESLHATDGWALEPFDEARLRLVPINPQVVRVSYVDSEGPIHSVPIEMPGRGQLDRFSIPLYLSLIQNQWTIVR